jgi:hypothetical protein
MASPYTFPGATAAYLCFLEYATWGTTQLTLNVGGANTGVQQVAPAGGSYFCVKQASQITMPTQASFEADDSNFWFGFK